MKEFVFGTLATVEKRVKQMQAHRQGVQHHYRLQPLVPGPGESVTISVHVELAQQVQQLCCHLLAPAAQKIPLRCERVEWDLLNWSYYQVWQAELPSQPAGTMVVYQIEATLNDESSILAEEGATYSYLVRERGQPQWAREAVVYQLFPDRFHPGNGRSWQQTEDLDKVWGGTLRGIIDRLDYIADLGFNAIWLNPFLPDHTHHGYHAIDYFSVNPRLGTMDEIYELVQAAHDRGLRLIMDFVAAHWGSRHPTFQEALADRDSPYYDWYQWIDWPQEYHGFFGVRDLPNLNVDHPGVRQYLLDSVRFWLGEVGFDGLRLDYALGPTHDFWAALRAATDAIRPDIWLFGEVVESPPTQLSYSGRLDGCLDFLLAQAMRELFALGDRSLTSFDNFLNLHQAYFPDDFSRPSFLDNHDMNRFLWLAGNDLNKLKLAALCQFTLAGAPVVYYGTEVGLSQRQGIGQEGSQGMAEARQGMVWGDAQDTTLHSYYRWLIAQRKEHPVLVNGRFQTVHLDEASQTYAYLRQNEQETALVVFNLSDRSQTVKIAHADLAETHQVLLVQQSGELTFLPKSENSTKNQ